MVECPTCGDDGFSSERSMKSHHTRVHGFKLDTYQEEQAWLVGSDNIEWTDENIDRFAAQLNRQIKAGSDRFDLRASPIMGDD